MAELTMDDWLDNYFGEEHDRFLDFYWSFILNNEHKYLSIKDIEAIYVSKLREEKINDLLND